MSQPLLVERHGPVVLLMLNRPQARNALDRQLIDALAAGLAEAEGDESVDVVAITGSDPAFCAGLDLKQLGSTADNIRRSSTSPPWPSISKPVIGAVNGPAVTGGLELALQCDFLIASERARFGDTHARVGLLPGWGLSVLLPQAIGLRRAKEMSLTGNFMDADEALRRGLVNRVVPHDDLLAAALQVGEDIAGNDRDAVRAMLKEYKEVTATTVEEGLRIEARTAREWQSRGFDPAKVARRRVAIVERGRTQL